MNRRERELLRVFERVRKEEIRIVDAAEIMQMSTRQCRRRYKRFREFGDEGLIHRGRGRPSNRRIGLEDRSRIIELYREHYHDFGPTLAVEKLVQAGYTIGRETLRRWLIEEGIWQRRRKRARHRSWRERKAHFGELVQMDGSHHDWFEGRADSSCLMNMADDATSTTCSLMDSQETTVGAMKLLWLWIDKYGIPAALYTDRKNVYVADEKTKLKAELAGEEALTQFGRACKQLGIRIIEARSPQAKGRIERSNRTYQDRLVKELRLAGIKDIESANRLLHGGFLAGLNKKFAVQPREKGDYHRSPKGHVLEAVFCIEEQRTLTNDWIVRFENDYYQIHPQSRRPPSTKNVMVRRYLDGQLHFAYRGRNLPYTKLPARPAPKKAQAPIPRRRQQPYIPPLDHPWRRSFKRDGAGRRPRGARFRPMPSVMPQ